MGLNRGVALGLGLVWSLGGCQTEPPHAGIRRAMFLAQDQRSGDLGPLLRHLRHQDPQVRAAAVRALGAQRDRRAADGLERALRDRDRGVRLSALLALSLTPGGDRWAALRGFAAADDPELCSATLRSLRPEDRSALADLPRLVLHHRPEIAGDAALALLRLLGDRTRGDRTRGDRTLGDRAPGDRAPAGDDDAPRLAQTDDLLATALARHRDPEVRWKVVYALAHLALPAAEATLTAVARGQSEGDAARLFATRGLAALPPGGSRGQVLLELTASPSPALVFEAARGLGRLGAGRDPRPRYRDPTVVDRLRVLATHPAPMVHLAATGLLGGYRDDAKAILPDLVDRGDLSTPLRAARLVAAAALGDPRLDARVQAALGAGDWRLRAAAATACGHQSMAQARPRLAQALGDADPRVRIAALETLPRFRGHWAAAQLAIAALDQPDLAVRETAATVLQQLGERRAVADLLRAYRNSPGLAFDGVRKQLLRAAASLDGSGRGVVELLRRALVEDTLPVQAEAARQLRGLGLPAAFEPRREELVTPLPGTDFDWGFFAARPELLLRTRHGVVEITLYPDRAPIHCLNLLRLIEAGSYRGRTFHRVAPNFLVQGGDHRNDGFGARAWHGGRLRDEISDTAFVRGVVGMPRAEDADTGGDQIFITTVPAPHLDRRYTVFGRVTRGLAVLERIEIGDAIEDISILRR